MAKPKQKSKRRRPRSKPRRSTPLTRSRAYPHVRILIACTAVAMVGGTLFVMLADRGGVSNSDRSGLLKAGAAIYAAHCASCHGAALEGQESWRDPLPEGGYPAPPHDASGHTWHHPDSQLFDITKFGGQVTAPAGFESRMPGFENVLSDAEIWAVLEFIKSSWPRKERESQAEVNRRAKNRSIRPHRPQ